MIESFRTTLAPDVVWENSGMPAIRSCDEAIGLLADQEHGLGVAAVDVEMVHMAEIGNVVLTERVDTLRRADGTAIIAVSLVGILELNEAGQITAWREYFDPSTLSRLPMGDLTAPTTTSLMRPSTILASVLEVTVLFDTVCQRD
jgi:limonene-1,2-epoxide hydrolase